jgi:hypothetical protein
MVTRTRFNVPLYAYPLSSISSVRITTIPLHTSLANIKNNGQGIPNIETSD